MTVHYTHDGEQQSLEIKATETVSEVCAEIEQQIWGQHEDLRNDPTLTILIAEEILNALSEDSEEITLGEVAHQ